MIEPSGRRPSRIAVAISLSVQRPIPVSASGVMLGTTARISPGGMSDGTVRRSCSSRGRPRVPSQAAFARQRRGYCGKHRRRRRFRPDSGLAPTSLVVPPLQLSPRASLTSRRRPSGVGQHMPWHASWGLRCPANRIVDGDASCKDQFASSRNRPGNSARRGRMLAAANICCWRAPPGRHNLRVLRRKIRRSR